MEFSEAFLPEEDLDPERLMLRFGMTAEDAMVMSKQMKKDKVYLSTTHQVNVRDAGDFWHLSIKRIDKAPVHDWRIMQDIKNSLCGPESEAVELYPAESRLVDTSNQYHLWVLKNNARFPVGWNEGRQTMTPEEAAAVGAVQREGRGL